MSTHTAKWPKGRDFDAPVPAGEAQLEMRCAGQDPEMFFPSDRATLDAAKQICRGCPARFECLIGATERREMWGVWGGVLFNRGRAITTRRGEMDIVARDGARQPVAVGA